MQYGCAVDCNVPDNIARAAIANRVPELERSTVAQISAL
jgi:hypothetical protein